MEEQTAGIILYACTGVGLAVWFAALVFVNRACQARRRARDTAMERFDLTGPAPENLVCGTVEVDGQPASLVQRLTSQLLQQGMGPVGQLKIIERTDHTVAFEAAGTGSRGDGSGQCIRRGRIQLTELPGGRSRVDYAVEVSSGRVLLMLATMFLVLGVVALVVGFVLVGTLVVPSPDPAVRGQSPQILQVSHFLWPPFLFGALYRRQYSAVQARFDTLVHNLPYYDRGA